MCAEPFWFKVDDNDVDMDNNTESNQSVSYTYPFTFDEISPKSAFCEYFLEARLLSVADWKIWLVVVN